MRVALLILFVVRLWAAIGVPRKFRNLTNRKLSLFWIDHEGIPYLNSMVAAGELESFTTYDGHKFFWAEVGTNFPLTSPGSKPEEALFEIDSRPQYLITDDTSNADTVAVAEAELDFNARYFEDTGRHWMAVYPREPPIFKLLEAPYIGYEHSVALDEESVHLLCKDLSDPSCKANGQEMKVRVISLQPRAFIVENFLSDYECDSIIEKHESLMTKSITGDGENAKVEKVRTSTSSRMHQKESAISEVIYRRMALVTGMPTTLVTNGYSAEEVNILHYSVGQEYTPHFDTGHPGGAERFISGIFYMNTPEGGGGTGFPAANGGKGLTVDALKGRLLFFYDLLEDGNNDMYSLHSGNPVEVGEKWAGAFWLWEPSRNSAALSEEETAQIRTAHYPSLFDPDGHPLSATELASSREAYQRKLQAEAEIEKDSRQSHVEL